jgi:hypothetical protein
VVDIEVHRPWVVDGDVFSNDEIFRGVWDVQGRFCCLSKSGPITAGE